MNYLVVVAHPDDEVLGAGGTIRKLTHAGHIVDVQIMSAYAQARNLRPSTDELFSDLEASSDLLGIRHIYRNDFPNIEFNVVPHIKLVQAVEKAIVDAQPDVLITHHPADTNIDHAETAIACQAALRLFQRRSEVKPIHEMWFMEVPSATEWVVNTSANQFHANTFFELDEEGISAKVNALSKYRDVMRPYPHPRSEEAIRGLAAYRGGQSGLYYAEAFECVFRRIQV